MKKATGKRASPGSFNKIIFWVQWFIAEKKKRLNQNYIQSNDLTLEEEKILRGKKKKFILQKSFMTSI